MTMTRTEKTSHQEILGGRDRRPSRKVNAVSGYDGRYLTAREYRKSERVGLGRGSRPEWQARMLKRGECRTHWSERKH